jgi:hypothetical protein
MYRHRGIKGVQNNQISAYCGLTAMPTLILDNGNKRTTPAKKKKRGLHEKNLPCGYGLTGCRGIVGRRAGQQIVEPGGNVDD